MNDFERTVWADAHYSIVGRALTFATRFEGLCRALHLYIGLKENKGILESEEEVIKLVNSLNKLKLVQHVTAIARNESELKKILDKGRLARKDDKGGRWFKYNLTLNKGRGSLRPYAETSETRCPGNVASCDGPRD